MYYHMLVLVSRTVQWQLNCACMWPDVHISVCCLCVSAVDILFWIGILMSMSNALTNKGVTAWFATHISDRCVAANLVGRGKPGVTVL